MSLYRVLVAHRGYRVGQVIETDTPVLRYVKEVPSAPGPEHLARPADPGSDVPARKGKRAPKAVVEVDDVADRPVSDSGLSDSEG
jgi:hypothetical protein